MSAIFSSSLAAAEPALVLPPQMASSGYWRSVWQRLRRDPLPMACAAILLLLVLAAVFVPVAFLGGLTGQLYKQFALTLAVSVILSAMCALTFTPAM